MNVWIRENKSGLDIMGVDWRELKWIKGQWNELEEIGVEWRESEWNGEKKRELQWTGMDRGGPKWTGVDRSGSERIVIHNGEWIRHCNLFLGRFLLTYGHFAKI